MILSKHYKSNAAGTKNASPAFPCVSGMFDYIIRSTGEKVSLNQADIDYAKNQLRLNSTAIQQAHLDELEQLKKITATLEQNVGAAFASMQATLEKTTQNLDNSFAVFCETCAKFNETHNTVGNFKRIESAVLQIERKD